MIHYLHEQIHDTHMTVEKTITQIAGGTLQKTYTHTLRKKNKITEMFAKDNEKFDKCVHTQNQAQLI